MGCRETRGQKEAQDDRLSSYGGGASGGSPSRGSYGGRPARAPQGALLPRVGTALSPTRPRPAPPPAARPHLLPRPRLHAPPLPRPRHPTKLATPRAAVAPPRRLAPACLGCRRARGREGDVRRVRAFLPFATRPVPPTWHPRPGLYPSLSHTGTSGFIKLAGHGSQVLRVSTWRCNQSRALRAGGSSRVASLHPDPSPPERLRLLPRSGEGLTPTLCQPADLIVPTSRRLHTRNPVPSPAKSCHLQGRA